MLDDSCNLLWESFNLKVILSFAEIYTMKHILFFLFFCTILSAQKIEIIELSKSISDKNNSVKTFTVIDQRPDMHIGNGRN